MALGTVLSIQSFATWGTTLTLTAPVPVGHTILIGGNSANAAYAVSDNLNGAYVKAVTAQNGAVAVGAHILSIVSTNGTVAPVITVVNAGSQQTVLVIEGTLSSVGAAATATFGPVVAVSGSGVAFTTAEVALPAGSFSYGYWCGSIMGTLFTAGSPWVRESAGTNNINQVASRINATAANDAFSGTYGGLSGTASVAGAFATFAAAASGPDYTQRKGSTFDATHTLGTITTATLNAAAITINSTGAGTVNLTDTSGVTTSGVYNLVLGDGAATQTQTVQVNVFGVVPSNNPAQKDGAALASLTGVQIRITAGANLNGTQVYYSGTETTNASGNFSTLDVSTSAAVAADPVRMQVLTAAGDSITSAETVELI
jgi:hypothetical protein